jgi:hypothetical protein
MIQQHPSWAATSLAENTKNATAEEYFHSHDPNIVADDFYSHVALKL